MYLQLQLFDWLNQTTPLEDSIGESKGRSHVQVLMSEGILIYMIILTRKWNDDVTLKH